MNQPKRSIRYHEFDYNKGKQFKVYLQLETPFRAAVRGEVEVEYHVKDELQALDLISRFLKGERIFDAPYGIDAKGLGLECLTTFAQLKQ